MTNDGELDRSISVAFDRLIDELRAVGVSNDIFLRRAYWEQYRFAHRMVAGSPDQELLIRGAGIGHFGFVQRRLGAQVTSYSVEIDGAGPYEEVLRELAERGGFEHRSGTDPVLLPFEDGRFDVAVSCGVLEHVREFGGDDQQSLRELHRVLRPGGAFVCLHLPNRYSASEAVRRRTGRPHHAFTYRPAEFVEIATRAGFAVETSTRSGMLPWIALAGRLSASGALRLGQVDAVASRIGGGIAQNLVYVCRKAES